MAVFVAKMVSLHDGTFPQGLLKGQVTGTSPLMFADLTLHPTVSLIAAERIFDSTDVTNHK